VGAIGVPVRGREAPPAVTPVGCGDAGGERFQDFPECSQNARTEGGDFPRAALLFLFNVPIKILPVGTPVARLEEQLRER